MMEALRKGGQIAIFNRRYKAARDAAMAKGVRFMRYDAALAKLKMRLVPVLTSGGKNIADIVGAFDEILGRADAAKENALKIDEHSSAT